MARRAAAANFRLDLYKCAPSILRSVHAFDVLGDPVRRRILELLADGELTSGAITAVVQAEFGISQPAVSQHLRVLRESGFATVRPEGTRRLYAVDAAPFRELDDWLDHFRRLLGPAPRFARDRARARQARTPPPAPPPPTAPERRADPMIDIIREIEAVQREVGAGRIAAGDGRAVRLQRDYDAPIEDVWDALTNPERIGRWFLPISGDYRLGGRYQFEGNAGRRDRRVRAAEPAAR